MFDDWSGLWEDPTGGFNDWSGLAEDPTGGFNDWSGLWENPSFRFLDDDPQYGLSDDDWRALLGGGGGDGGWPGMSSYLSGLQRLFGGGGGGSGGAGGGLPSWLMGLLGAGGTIYGGINNQQATREAQQRMEQAVEDANASTRSILGGASDAYRPYQEAGAGALQRLASMPDSNLAAGFGPVGQRSSLAGQFGPIGQASSLANLPRSTTQQSNLAAQFRPLGRR